MGKDPMAHNRSQLRIWSGMARNNQRDAEAAFEEGDTEGAKYYAARADQADAQVKRYERRLAKGSNADV